MPEKLLHILLVEDEEAHAELVKRAFENEGDQVQLTIASTLTEARLHLAYSPVAPNLIIADWRLPDGDGLELLDRLHHDGCSSPVVIMTSHGNERIAVEAIKAGALDYVVKSDTTLTDMPHIAKRAIFEWQILREQEQMQAALRESEARFRLLAQNSTDMISRHDPEGNYLYVSPACHTLLGYEPEELIGRWMFEFIHPEDVNKALAAFKPLFPRSSAPIVTCRVRRKDDFYIWLEISARPIPDPETGQLVEFQASSRDVTARKKAEEDLRSSEDRFRSLVQNSYDMIVVMNSEGIVNYESPSLTRILGYPAGYFLGKNPLSLVHPEDFPATERSLKALFRSAEPGVPIEFRFRHADGHWVYLESIGINLLAHPGVHGVVITSRDVSERKRSEAALQRAHRELENAYDATIEGWSHALDLRDRETEGHTQRVTEMTLKLASALGIPPEEQVHIRRGALLHDIGKMAVSDLILQKPGPLSDEEWRIMRRHPQHAYEMLSPIAYLRPALDIPYCHHEKWDGSGYPRGLKGEEIPLAARLFAIVDVWDALSSDRPYRKGSPAKQVIAYLREQAGKHFDPRLVEIFIDILENPNHSEVTQ